MCCNQKIPYQSIDQDREEEAEKEEELKVQEDRKKVINLVKKDPKQILKGNKRGKMLYSRYTRSEKSAKRMRTEQTQVIQWTCQLWTLPSESSSTKNSFQKPPRG